MATRRAKKIQREHVYLMAALSFLALLFIAYVYFVSASVVHVVIRKEVGKEVDTLHSEISRLEAEYINKQHSMSAEIASLQGFVAADEKIFIDRTDTSLVLSTNP